MYLTVDQLAEIKQTAVVAALQNLVYDVDRIMPYCTRAGIVNEVHDAHHRAVARLQGMHIDLDNHFGIDHPNAPYKARA